MFEADISRAIQLTLNAWSNNGQPLSAEQRQALENFLRNDPSSGPLDSNGNPQSFAAWLQNTALDNYDYLERAA